MANEARGGVGGVGFLGLLQLLFIGLKLGRVIDWSWWWVLAPAWGAASLWLVLLLLMFLYFLVKEAR